MSQKTPDQLEMPIGFADSTGSANSPTESLRSSPRERANAGPEKPRKKDLVARRQPKVDLSATSTSWSKERWLKVGEVATRFGVSIPTIWRWKHLRDAFPRPVTLSKGTTRWRLSDIVAFERALGGDADD